jgi:hypothetical protein
VRGRPSFDRVVNCAILLTCVVCAAIWADYAYLRPLRIGPGNPTLRIGSVLPPLTGVDADNQEGTLLIVISSSCRYCLESLPFYRALLSARDNRRTRLGIVIASFDSVTDITRMLADGAVRPDAVVTLDRQGPIRVRMTPTIVHLDRQRRVLHTWEGELPHGREAVVLRLADHTGL